MTSDIFGHIGYIFIALGLLALAQNMKIGWPLRFVGEFIWTVLGFHLGMTSLWIWGIVFMAVDIKGYLDWKRRDEWLSI